MFAYPIDKADAPMLNGQVEAVWNNASAISILVNCGWAGATTVTMKALYNEDRIFFLIQWKDPTLSNRDHLTT
ncbi:MAG: hypothetical protein IBX64_08300 [Actinobacteria bacterium]|nr:hypothetical protein [Actinomycetota bacterium]